MRNFSCAALFFFMISPVWAATGLPTIDGGDGENFPGGPPQAARAYYWIDPDYHCEGNGKQPGYRSSISIDGTLEFDPCTGQTRQLRPDSVQRPPQYFALGVVSFGGHLFTLVYPDVSGAIPAGIPMPKIWCHAPGASKDFATDIFITDHIPGQDPMTPFGTLWTAVPASEPSAARQIWIVPEFSLSANAELANTTLYQALSFELIVKMEASDTTAMLRSALDNGLAVNEDEMRCWR